MLLNEYSVDFRSRTWFFSDFGVNMLFGLFSLFQFLKMNGYLLILTIV